MTCDIRIATSGFHYRHGKGRLLGRDVRYAFQFRELSWMNPQVDSILKKFNAAFCINELAGYHLPLNVTTDFAYVRLHGPETGKYQASYSEERLRAWARESETWAAKLKAVCVYFDNDQAGHAARNALTLKSMVFGTRMKKVASRGKLRPVREQVFRAP
jgi:uncharacterized protein YecE (DUF72 family)